MPTFMFALPDGEARLGELILYISQKCVDDATFGATKLNKILWIVDFLAYARDGTPITGVEYQRLPQGPAPRRLPPVRESLIRDGSLSEEHRRRGGFVQKRPVALRDPDITFLSDEQRALIDECIEAAWGATAKAISSWSHGKIWQAAGSDHALIPYEAAFLSDRPITAADVSRTLELAARLGWALA